MAEPFAPFAGRRYLNLQTFRRSGAAVSTPVWFAAQDDRLYVYSLARAGKVKRIRNNARVRIAPCNAFGKLEGEWVEAQARLVGGEEALRAHRALARKYWVKHVSDLYSRLLGRERVVIALAPAA